MQLYPDIALDQWATDDRNHAYNFQSDTVNPQAVCFHGIDGPALSAAEIGFPCAATQTLRTPPNAFRPSSLLFDYRSSEASESASACSSFCPDTPSTSIASDSSYPSRRPSQISSFPTSPSPYTKQESTSSNFKGRLHDTGTSPYSALRQNGNCKRESTQTGTYDNDAFTQQLRAPLFSVLENTSQPHLSYSTIWRPTSTFPHGDAPYLDYSDVQAETKGLFQYMPIHYDAIDPTASHRDKYAEDAHRSITSEIKDIRMMENEEPLPEILRRPSRRPSKTSSSPLKPHGERVAKSKPKKTKLCSNDHGPFIIDEFENTIPPKECLCKKCGMGFHRSEHLKRHEISKHGVLEAQPCPYCGRKIQNRPDNTKTHMSNTHCTWTGRSNNSKTNVRLGMLEIFDPATLEEPVCWNAWMKFLKKKHKEGFEVCKLEDLQRRVRDESKRWNLFLHNELELDTLVGKRNKQTGPPQEAGYWKLRGWSLKFAKEHFIKDIAPEFIDPSDTRYRIDPNIKNDPDTTFLQFDPVYKAMLKGTFRLEHCEFLHESDTVFMTRELGLAHIDPRWMALEDPNSEINRDPQKRAERRQDHKKKWGFDRTREEDEEFRNKIEASRTKTIDKCRLARERTAEGERIEWKKKFKNWLEENLGGDINQFVYEHKDIRAYFDSLRGWLLSLGVVDRHGRRVQCCSDLVICEQ